jgi:alpha-D-xyloside xylohydrolase
VNIHTSLIHPGIWRIQLGKPERHTPMAFRDEPVAGDALARLPRVDEPAIAPAHIRFRTTPRGSVIELPMSAGEDLYGGGLQLQSFRQTGRRKTLRVNSDPIADSGDSHAPLPFYLSTAGYGVFVDTARYAQFHFASHLPADHIDETEGPGAPQMPDTPEDLYSARTVCKQHVVIEIPAAKGANIYVFGGPTLPDALRRYVLFCGGGCLPAIWGLGAWYRCFGGLSQDEATALAARLRERHMPCDVFGLEPAWQNHAYSCSLTWSQRLFPQPRRFLAEMRDRNLHVNLWGHMFTHPLSPIYSALKPHAGTESVWNGLVPDLTIPAARQTYVNHFVETLLAPGVSGFKVDECDHSDFIRMPWSFPEHTQFPSGLDGEQMHVLLGTLLQRVYDEMQRRVGRRTYGQIRSSGALSPSHPYVLYSDLYDHRQFLRGVCTSALGGMLWSPEVRHADSIEDLVRRVQSVALSAQCLVNAWYIRNPPWEQIEKGANNRGERMPNWEAAETLCRAAFQLRMSLVPYLYSAFRRYQVEGTPPVRPLLFDFPDDPVLRDVDDAWMLGEALLVAPLVAGASERTLRLPTGDWYDFYSNECIEGSREIRLAAPLDRIPLLVRSGHILPLAEPTEFVPLDYPFRLNVRAYGRTPAPFDLYEDDGETFAHEQGAWGTLTLAWDCGHGTAMRRGNAPSARHEVIGWQWIHRQGE